MKLYLLIKLLLTDVLINTILWGVEIKLLFTEPVRPSPAVVYPLLFNSIFKGQSQKPASSSPLK
jgi:hypothetical protein